MTGDEMEKVIDKIAEKAGVAVDKIQPIAEEVVRQVEMRAFIMMIVMAVVVTVSLLVGSFVLLKREKELLAGEPSCVIPCVFSLFLFVGCSAGFFVNLYIYIAPLASILGV